MRTAVLVLLTALATGCAAPGPPIDDDTFVEVLAQLHVLEARYEVHTDLPAALRDSLLTRYGVDTTALAETQAYWVQDPEAFRDLYTRVIDRLNAELGAADGGPVFQ